MTKYEPTRFDMSVARWVRSYKYDFTAGEIADVLAEDEPLRYPDPEESTRKIEALIEQGFFRVGKMHGEMVVHTGPNFEFVVFLPPWIFSITGSGRNNRSRKSFNL